VLIYNIIFVKNKEKEKNVNRQLLIIVVLSMLLLAPLGWARDEQTPFWGEEYLSRINEVGKRANEAWEKFDRERNKAAFGDRLGLESANKNFDLANEAIAEAKNALYELRKAYEAEKKANEALKVKEEALNKLEEALKKAKSKLAEISEWSL